LEEGLINDHTDGHIDNIARLASPDTVVCMQAKGADDPNEEILNRIYHQLIDWRDSQGRPLKIVTIPSPGKILSREGDIIPASYLNFYIGNHSVAVPVFGSPYDDEAVGKIGELFPDRRTLGLDARAILTGGGSFHCITQQMPLGITQQMPLGIT
jgi:agmatine deiminase